MNETPWTPGPWILQRPIGSSYGILLPDGSGYIGEVYTWEENGAEEAQANARLIQPAPEMAEAVEQTAAAMDALHPSSAGDMKDGDYARLWNAARDRLEELSRRIRGDGA